MTYIDSVKIYTDSDLTYRVDTCNVRVIDAQRGRWLWSKDHPARAQFESLVSTTQRVQYAIRWLELKEPLLPSEMGQSSLDPSAIHTCFKECAELNRATKDTK